MLNFRDWLSQSNCNENINEFELLENIQNDQEIKQKQINNKKFEVRDNVPKNRFRISINPGLGKQLETILRKHDYVFSRVNNSTNIFDVDAHLTDTGKSLQSMIFAELNNMFLLNDPSLITFVGSTEIEDFIDAEFNINIDLIKG